MSIYLDHVAIVPKDIAQFNRLLELLGLKSLGDEVVAAQKVKTSFWATNRHATADALIENLLPTSHDSTIQKYLDEKGGGIHHICFRVDDIVAVSEHLKTNGIRLIYDAPQVGAHDARVNFVHPKSGGGILVELSQK